MQIMPVKPYNLSILLKPYAPALKAYVIAPHFGTRHRRPWISASIAVASVRLKILACSPIGMARRIETN